MPERESVPPDCMDSAEAREAGRTIAAAAERPRGRAATDNGEETLDMTSGADAETHTPARGTQDAAHEKGLDETSGADVGTRSPDWNARTAPGEDRTPPTEEACTLALFLGAETRAADNGGETCTTCTKGIGTEPEGGSVPPADDRP